MKKLLPSIVILSFVLAGSFRASENSWIRINLLGYKPGNPKVAIWCSKEDKAIAGFELVDKSSGKTVFK